MTNKRIGRGWKARRWGGIKVKKKKNQNPETRTLDHRSCAKMFCMRATPHHYGLAPRQAPTRGTRDNEK